MHSSCKTGGRYLKREICVDDLPRWENGRYTGKVHWDVIVGSKVKFEYEDIKGLVEIVGYTKATRRLNVKYENTSFEMGATEFLQCQFGVLLGKIKREFIFKVGETIKRLDTGNFLRITEQYRDQKKNRKMYEFECLICGNSGNAPEYDLMNNLGCAVCSNRRIVIGYNDINTTNPELARLLWNPEDGYKYTYQSNKSVDFKCPNCQSKVANKSINSVCNQGLSCPRCSDGVSYPEKVMYNILYQTDEVFEYQKIFNWAMDKKYDYYIPILKCLIELHGGQHYREANNWRSFDDEQQNDITKRDLAFDYGKVDVEHYIVIDCSVSELKYIKNNILNSKLSRLLDFSKVNWAIVGEFSAGSLVKTVCDLWKESEDVVTSEIVTKTGLSRTTVIRYLKKGKELGWCNYDPREEMVKCGTKLGNKRADKIIPKRPIVQLSRDEKYIKRFESLSEAERQLGISNQNISSVCLNKTKFAGGYKWVYEEKYVCEDMDSLATSIHSIK